MKKVLFAVMMIGLVACSVNSNNASAVKDDQAEAASTLRTFTGTLQSLIAIGGETTGTGLKQENGSMIELDLATNNLLSQFVDGKKVTVKGKFKTVTGVETPSRQVLVVSSMVDAGQTSQYECPTARSIDCMPVTTNPMCEVNYRNWIEQNCPGVEFLD